MHKRQGLIALVMLLCICGSAVAASSATHEANKELITLGAKLLDDPVEPRQFALKDHHTNMFSNDHLKGKWSVVFFGYTSCSDICPTTLAALNSVYKKLGGPEKNDRSTQMIFVSVDPVRDTLDTLKEHVAFFNSNFLGVTGDTGELNKLSQDLGAYYDYRDRATRKQIKDAVALTTDGNYIVGHMADLFIFDPEGRFVGYIVPPHDPQRIYVALNRMRELHTQIRAPATQP